MAGLSGETCSSVCVQSHQCSSLQKVSEQVLYCALLNKHFSLADNTLRSNRSQILNIKSLHKFLLNLQNGKYISLITSARFFYTFNLIVWT